MLGEAKGGTMGPCASTKPSLHTAPGSLGLLPTGEQGTVASWPRHWHPAACGRAHLMPLPAAAHWNHWLCANLSNPACWPSGFKCVIISDPACWPSGFQCRDWWVGG